MIRCFISLDLPDHIILEIKKIQEQLQKQNLFVGKFTAPEHLHLTLKFLGEIDDEKIEVVKERLREVKERLRKVYQNAQEKSHSTKAPFFDAHFMRLGVFSHSLIRIIWLQLEGADELQKEIDKALHGLFPQEQRFMGHITIARVKKVIDTENLLEALKKINIESLQKQKITVNEFFLKKSLLTPKGSLYSVLEKYNLE